MTIYHSRRVTFTTCRVIVLEWVGLIILIITGHIKYRYPEFQTQKMADEITNNLVYLTENLTNLSMVLTHCVQDKIITWNDKDKIMAGETRLDKNDRFFDTVRKNWEGIKINIIEIFQKTSNGHCADKILEGIHSHKKSETTILDSKWWPEEKKLPKAFFERKVYDNKLIDVLKENLTKSKNKSTVINQGAAVSGMGGVGKTTVAKWFAIHFHESYDHIIWIDSGEDNLSSSFTDLARKLKIDSSIKLKTLARECFSYFSRARCLCIFDNAECYQGHQGIRDVLPKHENFHTIITSRTKEWGSESGDGNIPEMHLTAFPTRDSVHFFMLNLKDKLYNESQLEELSELLGNLPLALQIAVTTINTKKLSIDEYIERIKKTDDIIIVMFDDYEKTINKTMKISLDIIKNLEEDPQQISYKILIILGYIKPDLVKFELFQAIENLPEIQTKKAIELLEKYSLVTIVSNWWGKSCNIHRLLQQVIRHNDKDNAQVTIRKILSVEGFLDYKLLPYLHADEETQNLFSKVRARLVDQEKLEEFLEQRKFSEAVKISRMIKDTLKTPMAQYNYAVCLEKMTELTEAESVLRALHSRLLSEANNFGDNHEHLSFNDPIQRVEYRINRNINENGLWKLSVQIEPKLVRGLLFLVYKRLRMDEAAHEIINQDCQLVIFKTFHSLDYIMTFLKSSSISDYQLENRHKFISLRLGNNYGKKIYLESCSLSEELPNDLDHLSLKNVEMLNGDGRPIKHYDISISIPINNMKSLTINGFNTTKFAIQINDNLLSCHSIILENCIMLLEKDRRLTPTEIDLRSASFIQNGEEIELVCLNEFFDFHKTKKLTLHGSNMYMILDESLNMDDVYLRDFKNLALNDFNCQVGGVLTIKDTDVPLLENNTALRVNKLHLWDCSVRLKSLFFLSQSSNEIELNKVTIEIDEDCMERKMGICAAKVVLSGIKLFQDSVEVADILIDQILVFSKIKRLMVNTTTTFDLHQKFSLDYLSLGGVKLINWDKSTSSVKTLRLTDVVIIDDVLSSQFRVTETLEISNSVVDIASLDIISAATKKMLISNTSIHMDTNLDNNLSPKLHRINGQINEIDLRDISVFKDGTKIENLLVNEFINISQLMSLTLHTRDKRSSGFTLDMENISLYLDTLTLCDVTVIHWDMGMGKVHRMGLSGIPFIKRNNIKINSLEFERSTIDLSCIPENIQRIKLEGNNVVNCQGRVEFNDLNCVILRENPSELEYFSHCPNLTKVELGYFKDDELLLNLQWIPKSIETLKLRKWFFLPTPFTITGTRNMPFKLQTLILEDFLLSQLESALDVLKPSNIIFHRYIMVLTETDCDIFIKLMKSYKSVTIGELRWESDEDFQNCPLSKFAEENGRFYIFENQRGRLIQEAEFKKMTTL